MVCCEVCQDGWCHMSANVLFWSMLIPSGPHSWDLLSMFHIAGCSELAEKHSAVLRALQELAQLQLDLVPQT